MRLICFAVLLLSINLHAEPLGRLFFTPEQRVFLDKLDESKGMIMQKGASKDAYGSVEAKGGGKTVWIGGVPHHLLPGRKK